jgi:hypothetical protein
VIPFERRSPRRLISHNTAASLLHQTRPENGAQPRSRTFAAIWCGLPRRAGIEVQFQYGYALLTTFICISIGATVSRCAVSTSLDHEQSRPCQCTTTMDRVDMNVYIHTVRTPLTGAARGTRKSLVVAWAQAHRPFSAARRHFTR